jgi:hypothetical protein
MKNLTIIASTFCCIFLLATPSFGQKCSKRLSDGIVVETETNTVTDKTAQLSNPVNTQNIVATTENTVAVQPKRNDATVSEK